MEYIFLLISGAISLTAVSIAISKSKHPILTSVKSAGAGIIALLLVNLTSAATGCYISVNFATAFVSVVLSLPGVVSMLFLNILYL